MKEKQLTLKEQLKEYAEGKYDNPDVHTQIDAGWYDWFCKPTSLKNKTENLYKKVFQISKSSKFDYEKVYVFFKNNCPVSGPLYDSFSVVDIESGDVLYWVTPKSGHTGQAEVCGRENDFDRPLAEGAWKDIKKFFLN